MRATFNNKKFSFWVFAIIVFLLNFTEVNAQNGSLQIPRGQYNIILISIDSLRADHLGCYGYFRNTSPKIDAFAKESLVFTQAFCQGTWTLPSHASIFTSRYPFVHGAGVRVPPFGLDGLSEAETTLAEILKEHGYKTAAFTAGNHVRGELGFKQGFDIYYDTVDWTWLKRGMFNVTVPLAIDWVAKNKDSKFFLFLHGFDVHFPYNYPDNPDFENMFDPEYKGIVNKIQLVWDVITRIFKRTYINEDGRQIKLAARDIRHIIARYDGGIRHADTYIGEFLDKINKFGLFDNTIIIIISDHGMELFDHGHIGWCYSPYDEVLRVPFIMKYPGLKGVNRRIEQTTQLIDIMPTILDLLNIPMPDEIQGNSLIPVIMGEAVGEFNKYIYAQYGSGVLRSKKWKYVAKYELYNLEKDPKELHNVIDVTPEIAIEYLQKLKSMIENGHNLIEQKRKKIKELLRGDNEKISQEYGYW